MKLISKILSELIETMFYYCQNWEWCNTSYKMSKFYVASQFLNSNLKILMS